MSPARPEEKMMSRPPGDQAGGPAMKRLSNVKRRASPPLTETTKRSSTRPGPLDLRKARVFPSGENTGHQSLKPRGGEVRGCREKSRSERRAIEGRPRLGRTALMAKCAPSGDQEKLGGYPMCSGKSLEL